MIDFSVTTDKNSRKVETTTPQMEGIKLPMIVELGVDPSSSKPILMSIPPAVKLEDIPDSKPREERKKERSRDWRRVDAGVVRNAVPEVNMGEFKREVTQITKVIVNELHDKQNRVTVRWVCGVFVCYFS